MKSGFDREAAAGEADNARKDRRRLAVTRLVESQVVEADPLRTIMVTDFGQARAVEIRKEMLV